MSAVALMLAVALLRPVSAPSAEPAPAGEHAAWIGSWTLDKEKSDPPGRMLEAMEVPWYVKSLAKAFTPVLQISLDGSGLKMAMKTPLGGRTQDLRADDVGYPGSDQLDRKFEEKSQWAAGGSLVVDRTTDLPSGKKASVRSNWQLGDDALTNEMKVKIGDASPFDVRRVFVRESEED